MTGRRRWPQPCFTDYDPSKPAADAGHSFKIGLTITTDVKGDVSVGISAVKLGVSAEANTVTSNSLTVTFVQRGLAVLQNVRDYVDAVCKYPNALSKKCTEATAAYDRMRVTGEVGEQIRSWGLVPPSVTSGDFGLERVRPRQSMSGAASPLR